MLNKMEEKNEQLNKEILTQIKERKVEMKPHWIFILRTILGVLGAILVSLCLVFLVSFIFFGLRKSGVMLAPGFGPQGFFLFMMSLPWVLILISAAFLIVLQILINKYAFIYKKPSITQYLKHISRKEEWKCLQSVDSTEALVCLIHRI